MRIASIRTDGHNHLAVVAGSSAWLIDDLNRSLPDDRQIAATAIGFIEQYQTNQKLIRDAVEAARPKTDPITLSDVTFAPPIPEARKLLCVAGNYADHIVEGGRPSAPDCRRFASPGIYETTEYDHDRFRPADHLAQDGASHRLGD